MCQDIRSVMTMTRLVQVYLLAEHVHFKKDCHGNPFVHCVPKEEDYRFLSQKALEVIENHGDGRDHYLWLVSKVSNRCDSAVRHDAESSKKKTISFNDLFSHGPCESSAAIREIEPHLRTSSAGALMPTKPDVSRSETASHFSLSVAREFGPRSTDFRHAL